MLWLLYACNAAECLPCWAHSLRCHDGAQRPGSSVCHQPVPPACCPALTLLFRVLCVVCCVCRLSPGIGAAVLLADLVYDVPANVILDSARRALSGYDVITSCIKAWVFGLIISTVSAQPGGSRGVLCKAGQLRTRW